MTRRGSIRSLSGIVATANGCLPRLHQPPEAACSTVVQETRQRAVTEGTGTLGTHASKGEMREMKRAYSLLEIKAVDDDQRVITGIATTPEPDRVGDIVEPMGAKFANPLPLTLR